MGRWMLLAFLLLPISALSDTIRVATFNASLTRSGPGLLLRAIEKNQDKQIQNVVAILQEIRPDILLLNEFDFDLEGRAADAVIQAMNSGTEPLDLPYAFSSIPNTGTLSGFDLNDDGKTGGPDDAFGYGKFPGQYGMLLLSRFPIDTETARTFTSLLWKDLPGANLPAHRDGSPFPSKEAQEIMRLSSKSHWDVAISTPNGPLHIYASHPTPPVFDGPEDRNGLRNADEIRFWSLYLDGQSFTDDQSRKASRKEAPALVMGDLNADPLDGDGRHRAISALINHPSLQDPKPASKGALHFSTLQGGNNRKHKGDPSLDTADWNDERGPGNLRVDYILPTKDLNVTEAGVFWPAPEDPLYKLLGSGKTLSSDHRLLWVDLDW